MKLRKFSIVRALLVAFGAWVVMASLFLLLVSNRVDRRGTYLNGDPSMPYVHLDFKAHIPGEVVSYVLDFDKDDSIPLFLNIGKAGLGSEAFNKINSILVTQGAPSDAKGTRIPLEIEILKWKKGEWIRWQTHHSDFQVAQIWWQKGTLAMIGYYPVEAGRYQVRVSTKTGHPEFSEIPIAVQVGEINGFK